MLIIAQSLPKRRVSSSSQSEQRPYTITTKAAQRLYFITLLKRVPVDQQSLTRIYTALVRSVTEYACQVWDTGLTSEQGNQLESIQRRAMHIIYPDLCYSDDLEMAGLATLQKRRETTCISFFRDLMKPNHKLHHLLPLPHEISYDLRETGCRSAPWCRTSRFMNTLIPYGPRHWTKSY